MSVICIAKKYNNGFSINVKDIIQLIDICEILKILISGDQVTSNRIQPHWWRNCCRARLEGGRPWVRAPVGSNQRL